MNNRFNNIDFDKGHLDEAIRRCRLALDQGVPVECVEETIVASGLQPDVVYLAARAALIAGPMPQ